MTRIPVDLASLLGGLGLLLFSLNFLTSRLNDSISSRFRPILERFLRNSARCLGVGTAATVLVQASSITIVAVMGLVDSGLLSLEKGFFVTLGATLGTTVKAWFFVGDFPFGPVLIGGGSIALLFARHPLFRELLQLTTAIGLTFLGLEMLSESAAHLKKLPEFTSLLASLEVSDFTSMLTAFILGCALTVALQSSSAMVIIVIGLVSTQTISFPTAAVLVLGANLGTTSIALLASLQTGFRGRRIAVAHFLAKLGGLLITLLLFDPFLGLVEHLVGLVWPNPRPELLVAAVHTTFNLINLVWWSVLSVPFLRAVRFVVKGQIEQTTGLAPSVRGMLASTPERAMAEAENQFHRFELMARGVYDHALTTLTEQNTRNLVARRLLLGRNLEALKETLHDLLFPLSHQPLYRKATLRQLRLLEVYSNLTRACFSLDRHLERGLAVDRFHIPRAVEAPLHRLMKDLDVAWRAILLPGRDKWEGTGAEEEVEEELVLATDCTRDHRTWLVEITGYLRVVRRNLELVYSLKDSG